MKKETLGNIIILQDRLNEYITPNWKEMRTELDFMVANHQEMAELIDSNVEVDGKKYEMGWKWWKGAKGARTMDLINWQELHPKVVENVKIELTDLLFFTLSQKILGDFTDDTEVAQLQENDWINLVSITANNLLQRPGAALLIIDALAEKLNFNIAAYYVAKHTLNYIRQLGGYGGTYQKVMNGIEDNELLHPIVEDITIDAIDEDFEGQANKIMNAVYDKFEIAEKDRKTLLDWKNN